MTTIQWTPEDMLEIELENPDMFKVVKETLTRLGVVSKKNKTLTQSCHILHKKGRYYIVHFKEMFMLDNKRSTLEEEDIMRRNTIAMLLQDWGLLTVLDEPDEDEMIDPAMISKMKRSIVDEEGWTLVAKYTMGRW